MRIPKKTVKTINSDKFTTKRIPINDLPEPEEDEEYDDEECEHEFDVNGECIWCGYEES